LQSLPAGGAQDGGAEGGGGSPDGGDEGQYRAGRSNTRFQCPGDDTPEIGRRRNIIISSSRGSRVGCGYDDHCGSGLGRSVQGALQDWRWRVFVQL